MRLGGFPKRNAADHREHHRPRPRVELAKVRCALELPEDDLLRLVVRPLTSAQTTI
jgi:hypothetical protein